MTLLRDGGWVRATAVTGEPDDTPCALCLRIVDPRIGGWVSVPLQAFVCSHCLPDPDDEGAGQRAAERLAARAERARENWPLGLVRVADTGVTSDAFLIDG
jgi:hypothetical protein